MLSIANVRASDLSYAWVPPVSLAGDSYRVRASLSDGTCVPIGPYPQSGIMCLAMAQQLATDDSDGWFNIIGGASSGAPSINGLDAPSSLSVGQSGTWTVHASAPGGTQLRYSVAWGDEVPWVSRDALMSSLPNAQVQGSFTHTYQSVGTFTPTFTVSNDAGSAMTSASVVVGSPQTNICPGVGDRPSTEWDRPKTYCSGSWQATYSASGCQSGWQCTGYTCATDPHVMTMCPNTGVQCPTGQVWCGVGAAYGCVASSQCYNGSTPTL